MKKWAHGLVIINPTAGGEKPKGTSISINNIRLWTSALDFVSGADAGWPIIETTADGKWLENLEKQIRASRPELICVVGGDGTIAEVVRQILNLHSEQAPTLLVIPAGRGNDIVRGLLGFRAHPETFSKWGNKQEWQVKSLDVARVQIGDDVSSHINFFNMASIGYGGSVTRNAHTRQSFWSKTSAVYIVEGLLGYFESPDYGVQISVDGTRIYKGPLFAAFVGNGPANGHGLYWLQNAQFDDGKIDFCVFSKPPLRKFFTTLGDLKNRGALPFNNKSGHGREILFEFAESVDLELDGEHICRSNRYLFGVE